MIHFNKEDKVFHLQTENISYIIQILKSGHPANLYYGKKIRHQNHFENFRDEKKLAYGSMTSYSADNHGFSLNNENLEYSSFGKGDYRNPSISLTSNDGNRTFDFQFDSCQNIEGKNSLTGLPSSYCTDRENVDSLEILLIDKIYDVKLFLNYSVFTDKDVLTRNVRLENGRETDISIDKISSFSLDFDHFNFDLITLDGAWIRERHHHRRALNYGKVEISSSKGVSSPDHNPFMILCDSETREDRGQAYGFSLMYSGNHSCSVDVNSHNKTRIQLGINDFDFQWNLKKQESFQTPEVIFTYSDKGLNGLSSQFHSFIRSNIVRGEWQFKERPVLINNWEATYFDFNEKNC